MGLALFTLLSLPTAAQSAPGTTPRVFSAMPVFDAFARTYPDRVKVPNPLEGPQVVVGGQAFAWAEGRLLPLEDRDRWTEYAPQSFYDYPREVSDVTTWPAERLAQAEERLAARAATNLKRSSAFFDALWGIRDLRSADAAQRKIRFLGLPVTVHRLLQEPLARIEERLTTARVKDPSLDSFLKGLNRLEGYNWRDIAGTQSRSNHAYGSAVDVIPRSYGGKNPYWLWAPQENDGWYRAAWTRRWQPHPTLVAAFEAEGFVWGGKWLLFDTIHFEYRPEILVLSGWR